MTVISSRLDESEFFQQQIDALTRVVSRQDMDNMHLQQKIVQLEAAIAHLQLNNVTKLATSTITVGSNSQFKITTNP